MNEEIWDIRMNGGSKGMAPSQERKIKLHTISQNVTCINGMNVIDRLLDRTRIGISKRTERDMIRAIIPPSLLGIARRMAYAKRKYHSGLMWGGVTIELAGEKLSGSVVKYGRSREKIIKEVIRIEKPRMSLKEK